MTENPYRGFVLLFLLALIAAEIIWSWRNEKRAYELKDTLANISILAGFQLSKFIFAGYQLAFLGWAARFSFFDIPSGIGSFITCFILADFIYYWFHRASHMFKPLWAFHLIHHSSPYMNLTTSYRLNWLNAIISPLFFTPLALLGFSPNTIVVCYALNLLYQFFLHTEAVRSFGKLEGIIDSPSAHRVHHGSNPVYIDKNFGGVLMIWDRIFGTYKPETEKPVYGVTTGFISNNPFILVFKGFIDFFKGKMKYKG